jgi:hypothetical protein
MGKTRLSVAELLCRRGEASHIHGSKKRFEFRNVHLKIRRLTLFILSVIIEISLSVKKLSDKHRTARSSSQSIVRKTYELVVVNAVLAKTSAGNAHTAVKITVNARLRSVLFLKISNELLGS